MKKQLRFKYLLWLFLGSFLMISCKSSNSSKETFTLSATVSPSEAGSVSPAGGEFDKDEQIQLTASANSSWAFKEWNGDLSGNQNPASVTISKNMSVNALFEELTYPLTVEVQGEGTVSEQIVNAKADYAEGSVVQLTANPAANWVFKEWGGALSGTENPITITMDQAKTVTATFELKKYKLTLNISGNGGLDFTPSNSQRMFAHGTQVKVTATPSDEYSFAGWTGDVESTENPLTITMDGPKTVNANFQFGFMEDFEDGKAQNWQFTDDRFSVVDGKLKFATGNDGNWGAGFFMQQFSNFKVELRVARTKSKQNFSSAITLFIRANGILEQQKLENGYQINISQDGYGSVYKIEDTVATLFSPRVRLDDLNNKIGDYNTITINAYENKFSLYVNGKHLINLQDPTFKKGYIGVGTFAGEDGDNEVLWDYVKVSKADVPKN